VKDRRDDEKILTFVERQISWILVNLDVEYVTVQINTIRKS
jgi:hypothetical protein